MTITREALELAALAAGHVMDVTMQTDSGGLCIVGSEDDWMPHADIGDAARLAVQLGIRVTTPKHKGDGSSAEPTRGNTASCTAFRADPVEQTCIAITLCAAEIGRKMKGNQA